jgi:hypothetical protein
MAKDAALIGGSISNGLVRVVAVWRTVGHGNLARDGGGFVTGVNHFGKRLDVPVIECAGDWRSSMRVISWQWWVVAVYIRMYK